MAVGVKGGINHSLINSINIEFLVHARHWAGCQEVSNELRQVSKLSETGKVRVGHIKSPALSLPANILLGPQPKQRQAVHTGTKYSLNFQMFLGKVFSLSTASTPGSALKYIQIEALSFPIETSLNYIKAAIWAPTKPFINFSVTFKIVCSNLTMLADIFQPSPVY